MKNTKETDMSQIADCVQQVLDVAKSYDEHLDLELLTAVQKKISNK